MTADASLGSDVAPIEGRGAATLLGAWWTGVWRPAAIEANAVRLEPIGWPDPRPMRPRRMARVQAGQVAA
jgi:hypothetical protein